MKHDYTETTIFIQGREVLSVSKNPESSSLKLKFLFQAGFPVFVSKMNSRQENRSKVSFTAGIITKYSFERFLSICGEEMSKGFLKFCKLISNLILGQIIVSNLTNVHA